MSLHLRSQYAPMCDESWEKTKRSVHELLDEVDRLEAALEEAIEFIEAAKSAAQPGHTGWFAEQLESSRNALKNDPKLPG